MVIVCPVEIFGHIHIFDPQFALLHNAERVDQARFSQADRFDLRAGQHDPCRKRVEQLIIESRPLVLYLYIITNLLFHLILLSKTQTGHQHGKDDLDQPGRRQNQTGRSPDKFQPDLLLHLHIRACPFPYDIKRI